ncbi:uncharacterized protein LOC100184914 [Ciona intestinalis]
MTYNGECKYDQVMKVLLIGDPGVGKTQIVNKFTRDQFDDDVKPTVGVEYVTKVIHVKGKVVCLHIWDLAGREMFRSITNAYYHGAVGALIVYDITKVRTFENVSNWFENLARTMSEYVDSPVTMMVGNKVDLRHQRSVPIETAMRVAKQRNSSFVETSALTGCDVEKAFQRLAERIMDKLEEAELRHKVTVGGGLEVGSQSLSAQPYKEMTVDTVVQKQPKPNKFKFSSVVEKCSENAQVCCKNLFNCFE